MTQNNGVIDPIQEVSARKETCLWAWNRPSLRRSACFLNPNSRNMPGRPRSHGGQHSGALGKSWEVDGIGDVKTAAT